MNEYALQEEVKKSGYKIFRMKEHIPSYVKPDAADDDENDLNKDQKHIEITNDDMSARDAFFALMAIKMMKLSQKYNRKLEDLHDIFYTVSCDWQRLEEVLQASSNESNPNGMEVDKTSLQWSVLEDLAVRDDRDMEAYKHVVEKKGEAEVEQRRAFLEIDN